jgi:urease accessory protein
MTETPATNTTPPPLAGGGQGEGAQAQLLRLQAWLSPAFPIGAYAYSHGVEWAVECGDVADETTLCDWLTDLLVHGSGRNDAILLRHAHRGSDLCQLNNVARAIASSRERRAETLDQGTAFIAAAAAWNPPDLPRRIAYPIAVGALAARHHIDEDATAAAYLQAFTTNLISAAVRLVPLGQSTGLRILAGLEAVILTVACETRTATLDDIGGCAFRADLAAMHHETQYTRLFRS